MSTDDEVLGRILRRFINELNWADLSETGEMLILDGMVDLNPEEQTILLRVFGETPDD